MRGFCRLLQEIFESLFSRWAVVDDVDRDGENLFRLRLLRYDGEPMALPDGTALRRGDLACELHFRSLTLAGLHQANGTPKKTVQVAVAGLARVRMALPGLARYVRSSEKYNAVQVFFGKTLLYRGAKGLGFTVTELPPGREKTFLTIYLRWLLFLYHPEGGKRLSRHPGALVPKGVWISRQKLLDTY